MCDPDCLCVIFSFIRDEQPRVGLVVAAVGGRGGLGGGARAVGGVFVDSGGG